MRIKDILGIILAVFAFFTFVSMWIAMPSGNIEKGTEIFADSMIPWWINPLTILSASTVGVIIVVLIIMYRKFMVTRENHFHVAINDRDNVIKKKLQKNQFLNKPKATTLN